MVKKIGNPQGDVLDILINAKLGDGGMYQSGVNINSNRSRPLL